MRKKLLAFVSFLLIASISLAQTKTVRGTVTDASGNPVPFASIKVKGTKKGVVSDESGVFKIELSGSEKQLEISAVGFDTKTVDADDNMSISLNPDARTITTVTVTALGFKKAKDQSAFSNATVKGSQVQKSGESNLINGLAAKSPGVNITRSTGDPGAGAYILIRGQSTIGAETQPLIVVDGIPISNSTLGSNVAGVAEQSRLNDINPNDIESFEILKGASAAALWGSRASAGVIFITTKKGKNSGGKVNVSFQTTYSIDQLNRTVPLQTSFSQGANGRFSFNAARAWGDKIANRLGGADVPANPNGAYLLLADGTRRFQPANGTASNPAGGKRDKTVYDHGRDLFRTGWFWDNSISFSGGDNNGNFFLSLGNLEQKGILKAGSDYTRRTIRFNSEKKVGALRINTGLAYTFTRSNRVQQGSNLNGIFLGGLRTPPDFNNEIYEGTYINASGARFLGRQVSYRNAIGASTTSGYDNPFWVINRITNNTDVHRFIPSLELNLKLTDWLSLINRTGLDYYNDSRKENFPVLASGGVNGGQLTQQTVSETQINNDAILRAQAKNVKDFDISGLLGFNYNNRNFENIGATVRGFILPNAPLDLGNSAADQRVPFNAQSTTRVNSLYLQGNIGYKEMIFLDFSSRFERYSTIKDLFIFPSASLAYVFRPATFEGNKNFLSFGKLRASYGKVGVPAVPYVWDTYFGPAAEFESWGPALSAASAVYGGGYARSGVQGNPGIKPEIKSEFEVGTDLRFWNDRINFSGTYYRNNTKDVILSVQVPSSTGFDNKQANIGTIQNRGVELELGASWVNTRHLKVSSNFIFSRNINKVVDMGETKSVFLAGFTGSSSRAVEGEPLGTLWGIDFQRDSKGALVLNSLGFPQANSEEGVIGDPNPDWIGSFNTTVTYKGLTVSFLIDRVQGGDVWNGTKGALYTFGTHRDVGFEVTAPQNLRTYTGGTITSGTTFRGAIRDFGAGPVALTEPWYNDLGGGFGPVGSQFIEDGTRTRLREVSLGYTIKGTNFTKKSRLSSIDISITGRNLVLWTDYQGIDPETNLTGPSNGRGLDYFNNPSTRSYLLTIKINY
jgi:TonB-linked SusC/RagA family outer membrane protein